jgi:hypothetical protein
MPIPQLAIDRYLRLRQKSDDLFSARREAQEAWLHERGEVGRLDSHIRSIFPSLHIEIDDAGNVSQIEFVPGQPRQVGHAFIPIDSRHRKTPLRVDPGMQHTLQLLLAARRRLAQAEAHRQRVNATGNGVAALAEECLKALQERGWRPSGASEARGFGIAGVVR